MDLQERATLEFINDTKNDEFNNNLIIKILCETILHIPEPNTVNNKVENNVKHVRELYNYIYKGSEAQALKLLAKVDPIHLDYYVGKTHIAGLLMGVIDLIQQKNEWILDKLDIDYNLIYTVPFVLDRIKDLHTLVLLAQHGFDLTQDFESLSTTSSIRNTILVGAAAELGILKQLGTIRDIPVLSKTVSGGSMPAKINIVNGKLERQIAFPPMTSLDFDGDEVYP